MVPGNDETLLREEKAAVRRRIRVAMAALDPAARSERSAAICAGVRSLPEWTTATDILAYAAMQDEVDLGALIAAARATGKRVYLPRIVGPDISFFRYQGNPAELAAHGYGMLEPAPGAPAWIPGHGPALVLCPGRAFDRAGRRLGRGRGYYDRFLSSIRPASDGGQATSPVTAGVCFGFQLVDEVPAGPRDRRVDLVVTEAGVVRAG